MSAARVELMAVVTAINFLNKTLVMGKRGISLGLQPASKHRTLCCFLALFNLGFAKDAIWLKQTLAFRC
jgi:hypothetical protein